MIFISACTNQEAMDKLKGTCKKFEDRSKNYIIGEIIVGFKSDVTFQQAREVVESFSVTIKKADPAFLLVSVPSGQENNFIRKFLDDPLVRYAELNGCGGQLF